MILTFTDYGAGGPYTGQLELALRRRLPENAPIIHLMSDAPSFDPMGAGLLLRALCPQFPRGSVVLAVVDPGVGGERVPLVLRTGECWLVGPDNGLLIACARHLGEVSAWRVDQPAAGAAVSFHGRDVFAPVAADLYAGCLPPLNPMPVEALCAWDAPTHLAQVIYVDGFGNLVTGLQADAMPDSAVLLVGGRRIHRARVFCEVPRGVWFWYRNSIGLVEIAVNSGSAAELLNVAPGARVDVLNLGPGAMDPGRSFHD